VAAILFGGNLTKQPQIEQTQNGDAAGSKRVGSGDLDHARRLAAARVGAGQHECADCSARFSSLLALVFLFEALAVATSGAIVGWVVALIPGAVFKTKVAATIERLPPYPTLLVFLIPVILLLRSGRRVLDAGTMDSGWVRSWC